VANEEQSVGQRQDASGMQRGILSQAVAHDHGRFYACGSPKGRQGKLGCDNSKLDLGSVLGQHVDGIVGDDVQECWEAIGVAECAA
jgi:hypothetical protein